MCWNWQVSLTSFALIGAVSWSLWQRRQPNDRLLALFLASYGSMQLFEALMWLGQSRGYEWLNRIGSLGGSLLLYLHPLALTAGLRADAAYKGAQGTDVALFASSAVGLYGVWRIVSSWMSGEYSFLSHPDPKNGHLVWEFPDAYSWVIMPLMFVIAGVYMLPRYPMLAGALLLYFMIPVLGMIATLNVSPQNVLKNYVGSYWCWWVAAASFLFWFRDKVGL